MGKPQVPGGARPGLTTLLIRGIGTGVATPWVGISERLNIGLFLVWIAVLALSLLQAARGGLPAADRPRSLDQGQQIPTR